MILDAGCWFPVPGSKFKVGERAEVSIWFWRKKSSGGPPGLLRVSRGSASVGEVKSEEAIADWGM